MTEMGIAVTCLAIAGVSWFLYRGFLTNSKVLLLPNSNAKHLNFQDGGSVGMFGGLPVGTSLGDLELPALSGAAVKLSQWRGRKLLLIFFNCSCVSCRDLLPDLARLPVPRDESDPLPIIIATGSERENRRLFGRHLVGHPVLLKKQSEVSSLFLVKGTPAGYVLDENGATASTLVIGTEAVFAAAGHRLVQSAATPRHAIPKHGRRKGNGKVLTVRSARQNNLKSVDAAFPLGSLVAVTGAPRSGKSTLVLEVLYKALHKELVDPRTVPGRHNAVEGVQHVNAVVSLDQSPIGLNRFSTPATYLGLYDRICDLFAGAPLAVQRGFNAAQFNFKFDVGRCAHCHGQGAFTTRRYFRPRSERTCGACHGSRFNKDTLDVTIRGETIATVLEMSVEEASAFFAAAPLLRKDLELLSGLALDHLLLGQPAATLSGSETQRVKIAAELGRLRPSDHTVYFLDEPTRGLHSSRIASLLEGLNRLADAGHTVIVIEHDPDIVIAADHVIDLGREGGDKGGTIVAAGTPDEVAAHEASYTGLLLQRRSAETPAAAAPAAAG